jgi:putative FmdB family regulatory protein
MTYVYKCEACGHEWEAEQKITDEPLTRCPKCGEEQAKRQIAAAVGVQLKGKGWFRDGY